MLHMLKLSKKAEYALISLQHIASLDDQAPASAREIAEHYNIPPDILGKVMQALTRAEIVESIQGAKGGYRLRRSLADMVLGEVLEAVDGPVHVAPCTGDHYSCDQELACNIKQPISRLQAHLQNFVFSLSLETLAQCKDGRFHLKVPTLSEDNGYVLFEEEE